jgi:hypothetical protein
MKIKIKELEEEIQKLKNQIIYQEEEKEKINIKKYEGEEKGNK